MSHQTFSTGTMFLLAGCMLATGHVQAQRDSLEQRMLNSEPRQLLELSQDHGSSITFTSIADFESRDVREAPANVQVISARQIQASGAHDLYDALQLVPGISFGKERDDLIGVGVHGLRAVNGKCLFMLDGSPLNENDFGTFGIGMRIPIANVERIEVLLGPGSVQYGGSASLGVVNIVTRKADRGTGAHAHFWGGYSGSAISSTEFTVSGAHRLSRDQEISYMASRERGNRSNSLRLLPDSTVLNFADSTATRANTFQFNFRWRSLKASISYLEQTSMVSDSPYSVAQRQMAIGLEYRHKISRKVNMAWSLGHTDQVPWGHGDSASPAYPAQNTTNERTSVRGYFSYKPLKWLTARIGTQAYLQWSKFTARSPRTKYRLNGKSSINMNDGALFGELELSGTAGNLFAAYRIEDNSLAGNFAAPRIAYSKIFGPVNLKLMWGTAFVVPTVMSLEHRPNGTVRQPEVTETKGAELGIKPGRATNFTINAYDTRIQHPVALVTDLGLDSLPPQLSVGSIGVDARFGYESKKLTLLMGFGANQPAMQNDLPEHLVPDSTYSYQGLPGMRGYLVVAWDASPSLTIRGKGTWQDRIYAYQHTADPKEGPVLTEWPEELIFNAGLTWRPAHSNRFAIDMDCRNITNVARTLTAFPGTASPPFALNGREWSMALTYKFIK